MKSVEKYLLAIDERARWTKGGVEAERAGDGDVAAADGGGVSAAAVVVVAVVVGAELVRVVGAGESGGSGDGAGGVPAVPDVRDAVGGGRTQVPEVQPRRAPRLPRRQQRGKGGQLANVRS